MLNRFFVLTALAFILISSTSQAATINVFLLGGQSNMDGRADATELSTSLNAQTDVMFYSNSAGNKLTTLQPRTDNQFGPEITFGRSMADYYATMGEQVALIKYAAGGTNLYSQWAADGTASSTNDGTYYKNFQTTVTNALTALRNAHPEDTIVIKGMIWMQGESDAIADYSTQYETNLTAFINDIRITYNIADLPFVIGELSINQTGTGVAMYRGDVREAQEAVAAADPYTGIVNTNSFQLKSDNLHWDATGQQQLGYAFAGEMQSMLAIPEPSTYALLLAGICGLAVLKRRKSRN